MFRNTEREVTAAGDATLYLSQGNDLSSSLQGEARQKYYVRTELRDSITIKKCNLPQKDAATEFHACVQRLWPGEGVGERR